MTDDVVCRPLTLADFDEWKVLWDGYNAFYGRAGDTVLPDEVTRIAWARFHDPLQPMFAVVAEHQGRLVGLAHSLYHMSTTSPHSVCYMQDLFTLDGMRGKGVGRKLIADVAAKAKAAGATRLYWATHETNTTAMQLYDKVAEKSGFLLYRIPF